MIFDSNYPTESFYIVALRPTGEYVPVWRGCEDMLHARLRHADLHNEFIFEDCEQEDQQEELLHIVSCSSINPPQILKLCSVIIRKKQHCTRTNAYRIEVASVRTPFAPVTEAEIFRTILFAS